MEELKLWECDYCNNKSPCRVVKDFYPGKCIGRIEINVSMVDWKIDKNLEITEKEPGSCMNIADTLEKEMHVGMGPAPKGETGPPPKPKNHRSISTGERTIGDGCPKQTPNCAICRWREKHTIVKIENFEELNKLLSGSHLCIAQADESTKTAYNSDECKALFESEETAGPLFEAENVFAADEAWELSEWRELGKNVIPERYFKLGFNFRKNQGRRERDLELRPLIEAFNAPCVNIDDWSWRIHYELKNLKPLNKND